MPTQLEEIEGRFVTVKHRFDECIIGRIHTPNGFLTIKGDADPDELEPRSRYRFYGRFTTYKNKYRGTEERQFHFQTFVAARAHDRDGVVQYLISAGKGNGLGKATAEAVWQEFNGDSVSTIRENPRELLRFNRSITPEQCETIGSILEQRQKTENATIELTNLLSGRGFPKTTARKAIKKWGNLAAEIIRRDPYSLMNFRGCGFKLCDSLWLELGHRPDRLKRQALCAWYAVASNSEGHTWYPIELVKQFIRQNIGSADARPDAAIELAKRLARMSPDHYGALGEETTNGPSGPLDPFGNRGWIAEGKKAAAERDLAGMVANAISEAKPSSVTEYVSKRFDWTEAVSVIQCARCGRELTAPNVHVWNDKPFGPTCIQSISDGTDVQMISLVDWIDQQPPKVRSAVAEIPTGKITLPTFNIWPDPTSIEGIDDHQRAKLGDALVSRVAILGGSPGTGKTYATAMLIKSLLKSGKVSPQDIAIGAPTGKAAVRITEAMQVAGVDLRAKTWHSLLGVGVQDEEHGGWSFAHNERSPWPFRVIIGDESSMLDTALMRSIFAARPRGCHVLMVGDVNQLPPVGAGAPLRDLINSKCVGYGELTEIKRNSGGIVEACAAIRDDKRWTPGDNLVINDRSNQIDQMLATLQVAQAKGFDPIWDCQVLVAVNAKSKLSRKVINERLQSELNPNPEIKGCPFRVDDKIVCLKNSRFSSVETRVDWDEDTATEQGDEIYVANGELAKVIEVDEKSLVAELAVSKLKIRIPRGKPKKSDDGESESSSGCSWDLAYGLSTHKSQGSEWPVVIVMLDEYPGAMRVCSREWAYTSISRAKSKCILIGKKATVDAMCRQVAIGKRKTFLRESLQLKMAQSVLESIS